MVFVFVILVEHGSIMDVKMYICYNIYCMIICVWPLDWVLMNVYGMKLDV